MTKSESTPSSAQKRVLWEVRQRYNIDNSRQNTRRTSQSPISYPPNQSRLDKSPVSPPPTKKSSPPQQPPQSPKHKLKRNSGKPHHWLRKLVFLLVLLFIMVTGIFGYRVLSASNKISTTDRSILGQLSDLLFKSNRPLTGEEDGRINILLLAIGGEGHSGANLADTIMIASIEPKEHKIALLSIPRDLYVQVPDKDVYTKINAIHAYGETQKKDYGPQLLKQKVEEITGLTIHYYGRIDFTAFKQIVDAVGGVNINIENSFFDYWHKISFSAGTEKMDGERALAYVRARYIEGPEGGDFKRAARQQKVLMALRDKVFSVNTALDFSALNSILNSVANNIRTDMQLSEMKRFYEIARQVDKNDVKSVVLTTGPRGVLVGDTEILDGTPASVLKTRTGNYNEIKDIASSIFTSDRATVIPSNNPDNTQDITQNKAQPSTTPDSNPTPTTTEITKPSIEIRNGTNITGLAKSTSDKLKDQGYSVLAINNAAQQDIATTKIYILNDGAADGVKQLAQDLGTDIDSGLPTNESASKADVLIILGKDQ